MSTFEVEEMLESMDGYEKLLLYSAGLSGKDLRTKVKMQKLMFFVTKALPDIFGDEIFFDAHKKGPYSEEIDELLRGMEDKGLISLPSCSLTDLGNIVYNRAIPKEPIKSIVKDYKNFVSSLNEDEMLTLIYVTYPDYQQNSEEWDRLRRKRLDVAISMLNKQSISFSKAVEIADMSPDDFVDLLRNRNVRWRDA